MRALLPPLLLLGLLACRSNTAPDVADAGVAEGVSENSGLRLEITDAARSRAIFGAALRSEVLFGGMEWSEGPLVLPDGTVICSDVPRNHVRRWTGDGSEVWLENSGDVADDYSREPGSNGLFVSGDGTLYLAQHGSRRIGRMTAPLEAPAPRYEVVAERFEGKRFNSPNDLVVASDGSILFTDPPYGLPQGVASEIGYFGVYRVDPRGQVKLLTREYERPNGIGLSPDERTLYIGNSHAERPIVTSTPINDDWTLGQPAILIDGSATVNKEPGYPDGLTVARSGLIFATAPGGVWVVEPDGRLIAKVKSNGPVSNVELDPTEEWLYLTNDDRLLRVKLNQP